MTRLIDLAGNPRCGIFPEPIADVNYRDFALTDAFGSRAGRLRRHFAFNQFQFLGALCEHLVFGCAIADAKYAGTAFVYAYEPPTKRFREYSFHRPLAVGIQCDQRPETGRTVFRSGNNFIEMSASHSPRQRRLRVQLAAGLAIDAMFSEEDPAIQPMCICTPAGATGWVYARKTAGHRVSGSLRLPERTVDLAAVGARGHHDWTAGYMRRQTFWNWGCLAGQLADGRVVGLNVSCGVNETSFTENCFWLDGRLHKLDTVHFEYDRRDVLKPWRLTSFDGRLDLSFRPDARYAERLNALIVASNFQQLIGRYDGRLETATGERLPVTNLLGYAEHHYAKW
ncbi:MAG: DUF2804 domain-containing protein [Candidatus Binatia bacterium]